MLRHLLNSLIALILAVTPVAAQEFQFAVPGGRPAPSKFTRFASAACATDATNTTVYGFTFTFGLTGTSGVDETWPVYAIYIDLPEDSATLFDNNATTIITSGATINATEVADNAGVGLASASIHRAGPFFGGGTAFTVNASHSEQVTSDAGCLWVVAGVNGLTVDSSVTDDDAAGGALVLTTGTTNSTGGVMGACLTQDTGATTTWAVLTERTDTCHGEACYSRADANATGSSMSNTCDWSTAGNAAGAAIAVH